MTGRPMRHVGPAAAAVLGAALACSSPPTPSDSFRVVSSSPPQKSEGFAVTASLSVTFSHAIDPASAVSSSFQLLQNPAVLPVTGTVTVDGNTATFTPSEALPYDAYYHVDVSGLRDAQGRSVAYADYPWGVRTTFGDFEFSGPLPRFVATHYISPADVHEISRFRSNAGHDYSDDFETCRSMKHYFVPPLPGDWATVQIRAPVAGRVVETYTEEAWGTKVVLRSFDHHEFFFEIFHVALDPPLVVGDGVAEGQVLGHHWSSATSSDIAVGIQTPVDGPNGFIRGRRYVSYFDVMTDAAFADYEARGVADRAALVISAADRDAHPVDCPTGFGVADYFSAYVTLTAN